jgi:transglutaminase-like putative cysteine protease
MAICETSKQVRVLYPSPVAQCVRSLRVFPPAQRGGQQIIELQWRCEPEPDTTREWQDDFGNRVLELRHARIQREFNFQMKLRTSLGTGSTPTAVPESEGLPPVGIGAFLLPSALCNLNSEICRIAKQFHSQPSLPNICDWTHQALQYTLGTTDSRTRASQALALGKGVCQDYAHLMIALCRALRIPARYVSGYNPAEGLMHAWVEVLHESEWHAWDPTHNRPTGSNCVFVACGRDFRDVSPLTGEYQGRRGARLEVLCQTQVVEG